MHLGWQLYLGAMLLILSIVLDQPTSRLHMLGKRGLGRMFAVATPPAVFTLGGALLLVIAAKAIFG